MRSVILRQWILSGRILTGQEEAVHMKLVRILVATALAAALSPLLGLAQSTADVCVTACQLEYERSVEKCTGTDRDACANNAGSAYRTCMATCPGDKR
jgi:hypothetical protein